MPYIPTSEQLPFVTGFIGVLVLWLILYSITRAFPVFKIAITKTVKTTDFVLLVLNLIVVAVGISVTVGAVAISMRGDKMPEEQINQLAASAQGLIHLVYILVGAALGAIVIWIICVITIAINEHKSRKSGAVDRITISTEKLDSVSKDINDFRKVLTILGAFFKKIQETKGSGGDSNAKS